MSQINKQICSVVLLTLASCGASANPKISCDGLRTVYTYDNSSFENNFGAVKQNGIANHPVNAIESGCFMTTKDGIFVPENAKVEIELELDAAWEGPIDPLDASQSRRIMFDVEAYNGSFLEVFHYRLNDMSVFTDAVLPNGKNYVSATAQRKTFKVGSFKTVSDQSDLKIGVCQVRQNVEVLVKKIIVKTDVRDPVYCGDH